MQEIIFIVEESEEGGFTAKALGVSIFTEAVNCHFDDGQQRIIRLHYVKEDVFAA